MPYSSIRPCWGTRTRESDRRIEMWRKVISSVCFKEYQRHDFNWKSPHPFSEQLSVFWPRNRHSVTAARKIIIQNGAKYKWHNWQNALTVEDPGFVACVSIELTTLALLAPLSTTWANWPRPMEILNKYCFRFGCCRFMKKDKISKIFLIIQICIESAFWFERKHTSKFPVTFRNWTSFQQISTCTFKVLMKRKIR